MSTPSDSIARGSIAVRLYDQLRSWSEDSTVVTAVREMGDEPELDVDSDDLSGFSVSDEGSASESTREPIDIEMPTEGPRSTSIVYRFTLHVRRFVLSSWLYRWLTSEPNSEVILIDLRETFSAGPVLRQLEQRIRDVIGVIPTSLGLRGGFQLRSRFVRRPIRVLSVGLVGLLVAGLGMVAVSGGDVGLTTFVLLALLLVAVRGTQSTRSLAVVQATWWYERLGSAIESSAFLEGVGPPADASQPVSGRSKAMGDDELSVNSVERNSSGK